MPELVTAKAEIVENVLSLERLRAGNADQQKFWRRLIKNNKYFVVLPDDDGYLFAPRVFVGYRNNGMNHSNEEGWDRRKANQSVDGLVRGPIEQEDNRYDVVDAAFRELCKRNDFEPSQHELSREYWIIEPEPELNSRVIFPDEIPSGAGLYEGAMIQVTVNRYERSPRARADCIAHYGVSCQACGEDFEKTYGERGAGFIHVHHIVPLSHIRKGYQVDPKKDLRPVCPNCHAMLHGVGNLLTVEELRAILYQQGKHKG